MMLVACTRPERVKVLVGIAAAPDFTSWGFTADQKALIRAKGRIEEPSEYDEAPYVTTLRFWESGERNLVLNDPIPIDVPVRLLHGHDDNDVPWPISPKLANRSEEHTSELQSLMRISYAVFCLKKKTKVISTHSITLINTPHALS